MNIPLLLYLLYALKSGCALGGKKNNITDGETLDVTKDSEDSIAELILEKENGLDGRKFEVRDNVRVTMVTYNGTKVWRAGCYENCTVITFISKEGFNDLLGIGIKFKTKNHPRAYERNGDKWTEINEEVFETKFKKMQDKPEANAEPSEGGTQASVGSIDVSKSDSTICHAIETHIDGVPSKVFIPKPSAVVKIIMDGDKYVWMLAGAECLYSIIFLENGKPKMAYILSKTADGKESRGFRKYKVEDGTCSCIRKGQKKGWHVSKKKYGDKINKLKSNTNAVKKFTLDLSTDKDDEKCQVTRENKDGHTTRIYATKSGHTIEKVVDNGREVWSVPADHICFLCELHSSGKSKLLRLHVKSGNYIFTFHTFESSGEGWNGVDGKDFAGKLEEMKKRSESKKT